MLRVQTCPTSSVNNKGRCVSHSGIGCRKGLFLVAANKLGCLGLMLLAMPLFAPTGGDARAATEEIQICTVEWPPYTSHTIDRYGVAAELVSAVFSNMEYSPQFLFTSTRACEKLAAESENIEGIRGAFPFLQSQKRENMQLMFSEPLFQVAEVVFFNKNRTPELANAGKTFRPSGYSVGSVKSYAYSQVIEDAFAKNSRKKEFSNEIEAFSQLVKGNLDLLPADHTVGMHILKTYFPRRQFEIDILDNLEAVQDVHFMVSDRNPHNRELLRRFNASLADVRATSDFKYRIRRIQENRKQLVRIESAKEAFVVGRDTQSPKIAYILPRGTLAEVIKWAEPLVMSHPWPLQLPAVQCTEVLILNGPHKGLHLCVDSRHIVLSHD